MAANVQIQILGSEDATVLQCVAEGVFDHAVDPQLTAEFLADPRHHIAVATTEGRVVGMASGFDYIHPDKTPEMFINEVGVAPSFQRQGIARRLIDALLAHARTLGCNEAWVATELDNKPARALYRNTGGKEEEIVYYTYKVGAR